MRTSEVNFWIGEAGQCGSWVSETDLTNISVNGYIKCVRKPWWKRKAKGHEWVNDGNIEQTLGEIFIDEKQLQVCRCCGARRTAYVRSLL